MVVWVVLKVLGAVLLVLFFLVAFVSFWQDPGAARARLASIPSEVHSSQCGDIEYCLMGSGPTVLVVHGVTGGIDQGQSLAHAVVPLGESRRFLYVSRFGYVKSSLSAGGPSSIWFAINHLERTRALILLSSAAPSSGTAPAVSPGLVFADDFLFWTVVKLVPDTLTGLLLPKETQANLTGEERASIIRDVYMASLPISRRMDGIMLNKTVSNPSVNDIPFEQVKVPTLVLQVTDDPREKEGGTELGRRVAGSILMGLTGGHFLLHQEETIRAEIGAFMAERP